LDHLLEGWLRSLQGAPVSDLCLSCHFARPALDRGGCTVPQDDAIRAIPIEGGSSRRICSWCSVDWAPDGKFFYIGVAPNSQTTRSKTLAIPVPAGETLPKLPSSGIRGPEDAKAIPGTRLLDGWFIAPGPEPPYLLT